MNFFWLFALLAPICFSASNLVDNHVLHKRLNDPVSYDVLTIWPTAPIAIVILLAKRVSFAFDAWFVGGAVGFTFAFLVILYCFAMMREQGTSVVSVIYTSPLFVAILAVLFLGERLSAINYAGVLSLVASAFLVLYKRVGTKNLALVLMLVYALMSAVARVVTKSALEDVDIWSYFFWFLVGGVAGSLVLAALRWPNLEKAIRRLDTATCLLICATTAFSTVGLVLLYSAFSLGSVTIASGLTAISPTVLFLYSGALVRLHPGAIPPERITGRGATARKMGAVLLIILGALALTGA